MSIFGVQYRSTLNQQKCLEKMPCAPKKPVFSCRNKKALLLDSYCNLANCCEEKNCKDTPCQTSALPKSAIVDGERVLRPWAVSEDCSCCEPPPICEQICTAECEKKTKIVQCRTTLCCSVIVKILVFGGPEQCLTMFIDLPQCECADSTVHLNTRSISLSEDKCGHCQVPCEFVQFKFDRKKSTPSGVHLTICFSMQHAPKALLEKKGPCCCYIPFCLEFEVWREPEKPCCLEIETFVPQTTPQDCTIVDGCCTVNT